MGDFFLLQMGDLFTEGMCFDVHKEGRGSVGWALPHCAKGKAKGRSQADWKLRPMIEAGTPSTGGVVTVLAEVCSPHRG
jgi:hypothetical protein